MELNMFQLGSVRHVMLHTLLCLLFCLTHITACIGKIPEDHPVLVQRVRSS